ncbi:MAG: type II CRISPR RNA-guided endonuclease Cas9 [Thermoguttaceae bacterium]|nr:type II CRISPR RNA-guided endonuclease Cas9 [Thermoguttaceae bacterium]
MKYILGLDLGVGSVGWAVVPCDPNQISETTLKMGSRVFDPGMDGNIEMGKDESRNLKRRAARGIRRNFWRRRRRAVKLFHILQNAGLLPPVECRSPEARQALFNELDKNLRKTYFPNASRTETQTFLYRLRAKALDEELSLEALGRIFYSFGQRRGFQSNKKMGEDLNEDDKELGKVKGGIAELETKIRESGSRTLGEYFASVDPEEEGARIRGRYVGRAMYKTEFEAIWKSQARFHSDVLTDALKEKVFKGIFFQRPLKVQKFLVGHCELEPDKRCIAKGDPLFQEFRYWQRLLDLQIRDENGRYRPLSREEQDAVASALETSEKLKFDDIRKLLDIPKPKRVKKGDWDAGVYRFNFELDGESSDKGLVGNRTRAKIREALAESGAPEATVEQIDRIAREILFYDNDDALARKLQNPTPKSGLPEYDVATSVALSKVRLEPDYGSLSRKAIDKLLALMKEKRIPLQTARKELYGDELRERASAKARALLDPVVDALGQIRNPTVTRSLTELRKVVNAIIRRYGKPEFVRVELARDLKRGKKEREEIFKRNNERKKEREKYEKEIPKLAGYSFVPTKRDILKYRLWLECGGVCPYTGKTIDLRVLFAEASPIDIEHIIPFSVSLDDSFGNKTLCFAEENRSVKRNRTPFQCYAHTEKWGEILKRVAQFRCRGRNRKLELFKMEEVPTDIAVTRLLNDTRYISRLALKYLDTLYGAVNGVDAEGTKRVQVALGDTTAWLRDGWKLNVLLLSPDEKQKFLDRETTFADVIEKNRADHRHHAIDAAVVALTDAAIVKKLNERAEIFTRKEFRGSFLRDDLEFPEPCPNFREILGKVLDDIIVSRRVDRKVSGPLHEETNYGRKVYENKGAWRTLRKPLSQLSAKDVDNIVDPRIRELVQQKVEALGGDIKKLEADPPYIRVDSKPIRWIPIKSVRFRKNVKAVPVGKRGRERYVAPGDNHHLEVYAVLNEEGNEKRWEAKVISLMEAYRRKREGEPIVQRDFGPKTRFLFSLANGEAFTMVDGKIYVVRAISQLQTGVISLSSKLHTDARLAKEILATKGLIHNANTLKDKGIRKIYIDVLGDVYPCND